VKGVSTGSSVSCLCASTVARPSFEDWTHSGPVSLTPRRRRLGDVNQTAPHEQLEAKLIYAPRRVWKAIERLAATERRGWRDQAAILLERACAEVEREQVA